MCQHEKNLVLTCAVVKMWRRDGKTGLLWLVCPQWVYLLEQLWGRISCQDGWGHVRTDSVQLLDLSPPHLQQPLPSFIHPLSPCPLTLQVEREARLLPLSPENTQRNAGNDSFDLREKDVDGVVKSPLTWKGLLQLLWLSWRYDLRSPSRSARSRPRHQCGAGDAPLPDGVLENRTMWITVEQ